MSEERTAKILPNWSFWGVGVVVVKKEEWFKAERRIKSILKQLNLAKEKRKEKP